MKIPSIDISNIEMQIHFVASLRINHRSSLTRIICTSLIYYKILTIEFRILETIN